MNLTHTTLKEDNDILAAQMYLDCTSSEEIPPLLDIIQRLDTEMSKAITERDERIERLEYALREHESRVAQLEAENKIMSEKLDELCE